MNKTIRPFLFFVIVCFSLPSYSRGIQKKFLGFSDSTRAWGLVVGEPVVARYSLFTNWKKAWNFSAGYSFNKIAVGLVDHVWYFYNADDKIRDVDFWNAVLFYLGGGAKLGVGLPGSDGNDNFQVALRLVSGVEYVFVNTPWSLRLELVPEIYAKGKSAVGLAAGIGLTYYFESSGKFKKKKVEINYDPSEFD